jgi:2-methylcitrate dehydratase PrpD
MRPEHPGLGPTEALANFVANLEYDWLDTTARLSIKRHLLDTVGAIIAGSHSTAANIAQATLLSEGRGETPAIGLKQRWTSLNAAYLMGVSAHGLEVDDGYRAGSVHPGAPVIPAVLASAYGHNLDGRRVVTAIAAGYEVVTRIAEAIHPESRSRGFHNTPIAGVFGAAAGVASILGLGPVKTAHALGIAASSACGIFAFLRGGGEIKRLHPGLAAREGFFAAQLAANGMTGPKAVLEVEDGFLQAYGPGGSGKKIAEGLGLTFNVSGCYLKPHACCRHIHPAIDAVIKIVGEANLSTSDIEKISVGTYRIAAHHTEGDWADMASAQMNYLYCTAVATLGHPLALSNFSEERLRDPAINDLCGRVHVTVDDKCERDYPSLRSAKILVTDRSGKTYDQYVDEPLGSARYPLSNEALIEKFKALVVPSIGRHPADRLIDSLWKIETSDSFDTSFDELTCFAAY